MVLYSIILVYYIQGHTHLTPIASHIFLNTYVFPSYHFISAHIQA